METREASDHVALAVLEEKVGSMADVVGRLDQTIEKLSNLNVNMSRMLAVHEEKFEYNKKAVDELDDEYNALSKKFKESCNAMEKRLNALEKRIWIASGILTAVVFLFNAGMVNNVIVEPSVPSAIMGRSRPQS